jgi:hypothetical protein
MQPTGCRFAVHLVNRGARRTFSSDNGKCFNSCCAEVAMSN